MSSSFTGSLVGISCSKFTKFTVPALNKVSYSWPLGAIYNGYSPCSYFEESLRPSVAALLHLHDSYMAAACDATADYTDALPSYSYAIGALSFELSDKMGGKYVRTLPMLIAPDFELEYESSKGRQAVLTSGVRGLFCPYGLVVKANPDSELDTSGTFMHELFHAIMYFTPYIKDEMYGDDDATRVEEMAAHLLTDKRSMLMNAATAQFSTAVATHMASGTYTEQCGLKHSKAKYYSVQGFSVNGEQLIARSINLQDKDKLSLEQTSGVCREYFAKLNAVDNNLFHNEKRGKHNIYGKR